MAQHFVTVCVVCVLCAAHNPCSAHTDFSPQLTKISDDTNYFSNSNKPNSLREENSHNSESLDDTDIKSNYHRHHHLENAPIITEMKKMGKIRKSTEKQISRQEAFRSRRHVEVDGKYFTRKVFETYGNGENMTMKGFEKLLKKLGLVKLIMELDEGRGENGAVGEEIIFFFIYSFIF